MQILKIEPFTDGNADVFVSTMMTPVLQSKEALSFMLCRLRLPGKLLPQLLTKFQSTPKLLNVPWLTIIDRHSLTNKILVIDSQSTCFLALFIQHVLLKNRATMFIDYRIVMQPKISVNAVCKYPHRDCVLLLLVGLTDHLRPGGSSRMHHS